MCTPYNDLPCNITMSTVGSPDAAFFAGQVGDNFQFRGIELGNNAIAVQSPNSLLLDVTLPLLPNPSTGFTGVTTLLDYAVVPLISRPTEIALQITPNYNSGILASPIVTIPISSYYEICFNPTFVGPFPSAPTIVFRIKNSTNVIFGEIYSELIGNDETTVEFNHVMLLPADTYTFTVQATGLSQADYDNLRILESFVSIKRVSL